MSSTPIRLLCLFLTLLGTSEGVLASAPPRADSTSPDDSNNHEKRWEGFTVYTDQDVFFKPAFDQDYTMGLEFVCQGRWVRDRRLTLPLEWLDRLSGFSGVHDRLQQDEVGPNERVSESRNLGFAAHSVHFGDTAFTPAKAALGQRRPIHDDRPYANILYLKVRRTSAKRDSALVSDLTVGMLGLGVAEWVQTKIHTANGDVLPGGWDNQISAGGEPTLKYRVSPRWRLLGSSRNDSPGQWLDMDLAASLELNVGYYTNVGGGGRFRLGLLRSAWWNFERNAIADVRGPRSLRSIFGGEDAFVQEAYAWASGGGTTWAYNALLQGQFQRSEVELSYDPRSPAPLKRYTGDAQVGFTLRVRPGIFATYAVQWLSPTFGGPKQRMHSWGSIYFGYQK